MKIELNLTIDSYNSYTSGSLIIECNEDGDNVFLRLSGQDREVAVSKTELKKIIEIL
jgi:hypothetical protein